jgi:hypothetical protein
MKKIIIACEFSGRLRDAFLKEDIDAVSCDLIPSETPGPHIICDNDMHLKDILYSRKYMACFAFPPCTRLANSVWWYILKHGLQEETRQAAIFFNMIGSGPYPICQLENPIQNKLARKYIVKYDQIIQPYNFGEDASKQTCLWLRGLPKLQPTLFIPPGINGKYGNQTPGGGGIKNYPARNAVRTAAGHTAALRKQWQNNGHL